MVDYASIQAKTYKHGDTLEASGIYRVNHDPAHHKTHEVTLSLGKRSRSAALVRIPALRLNGSRSISRPTSTSRRSGLEDIHRAIAAQVPVDVVLGNAARAIARFETVERTKFQPGRPR